MNNIEKLIANYRYKHPLAEKLGGEFIMQCDEAQIDAIQLVCDIFENVSLMQEPYEDAISRAWLKEAIHNFYYGLKHTPTEEDIQAYIDVAPTVTPKPKTGHWIMPIQDDGMSDPIYYQVRCSNCGFDIDPQIWYMDFQRYGADKYCPKCGAKMVEP